MKNSEKIPLKLLIALSLIGVIVFGGIWLQRGYGDYLESRRRQVSREEIESRSGNKTHAVLVLKGTVDGHNFELVMRGFTNYFMKETWGAERGQNSLLGGQKPGGYKVVIRTANFTGEWSSGWRGTHGGGGGGGFDEYQDDMLPGRWLWNQKGLVGAKSDYEYHHTSRSSGYSVQQWEEQYSKCEARNGIMIPKKISWQMTGKSNGQEWRNDCETDVLYKIQSFEFQDEPLDTWFSEQVKKYFPDSAHFKITNALSASVSTNQ